MSDKKAAKKDQKTESLKKDDKKEIKETKESKKELAKAEAKKAEAKKSKKDSSSSSSDDSSSDDEPMPPAKATKDAKVAPKADAKKKKDSSSSDSSSDSDSDDKPKKKEESKKEAPKKEEAKKEAPKKEAPKKEEPKKGSKKDSSSSDSSSDSDSDEKPAAKKAEPKKEEAKKVEKKDDKKAKKDSSSDSSSDDSSSEEEKEPKKRKADEIEAKAPPAKKQKTEAGSVATGSTETVDDSITKCFVGNLSFDIDDDAMKAFFKEGGLDVVDIQWFNTKEGKFRGCGLIDFGTGAAARKAAEMSEKDCLGRAIKINLDKPKESRFGDAGGRGARGGQERRPPRGPTAKPDGCDTIFIGNLSYDIQDENVKEFFADCGEVLQIRWPTRPDGSFPGIGFVQFSDTNATDKAVAKAGASLLGRPIRCDFAESKRRNE